MFLQKGIKVTELKALDQIYIRYIYIHILYRTPRLGPGRVLCGTSIRDCALFMESVEYSGGSSMKGEEFWHRLGEN